MNDFITKHDELIPTLVIIVLSVLFIVFTLNNYHFGTPSACSSYANQEIRFVPARCWNFFTENK